jgi:hypothetical protein
MKKPLPTKSISDLRKEHEIAQLQQTIRSLRAELHMERSRRQLAEAQVEYLSRNVDDLKTDVAYWKMSHDELLDINESMQRSLYIYEEHAGSEEEVRIDMAIAELMDMTDNSGQPLITMGRQWWGIYRILVDYHDYPAGYTKFVKRMTARGMDKARVPLKLSSLKAIAGTIFEKPFEHWPSLAHKVPQAIYQRHYDVANVLWTVLVRGEG